MVPKTAQAAVLALVLLVVDGVVIAAQCEPAEGPESRLRIETAWVAALVRAGASRSPTLKRLMAEIERTDGLVYLSEGSCMPRVRACLLMQLDQAGPSRMLRVHIEHGRPDDEAIIAVGHELHHVMEVLGDTHVRSTRDMFVLYQRIGLRTAASVMQFRTHFRFETMAAIQIGNAIRAELSAAKHR